MEEGGWPLWQMQEESCTQLTRDTLGVSISLKRLFPSRYQFRPITKPARSLSELDISFNSQLRYK